MYDTIIEQSKSYSVTSMGDSKRQRLSMPVYVGADVIILTSIFCCRFYGLA